MELDVDDLGDPEASPGLPAATLAAGAAAPTAPSPRGRHGTYEEIWKMSWPVMLSQILVSSVSLVDIAMVGRLGSEAVAAVGYATQFFFFAQSALFAVGFACVALMARAIGVGDLARARRALAASLGVALATSLTLIVAVLAAPRPLLRLLGAEPAVIEAAVPYLVLLLGSSVLLAISLTLESGMRADKDTATPMRIAAVAAVVKIALNSLLILGALGFPRLELVGAGLATVLSQLVALALFGLVVVRAPRHSPLALRARDFAESRGLLPQVVRIALPGIAERVVMNLGLLSYFRILAEFGTVAIAAYTVGIRVLSFSWIPGIAFATAAGTLVGQALGARDPRDAARAGWRSTRLAVGVAVALGLVCGLARVPLSRLFTNDPSVVEVLAPFILCLALAQPFLQAHFTLAGAHRGAGDTWTPLLAATLGNWAFRVPLALLFAFVLRADLVWVWYPLIFDHLVRAAWLAWSFRRGRWQTRLRT